MISFKEYREKTESIAEDVFYEEFVSYLEENNLDIDDLTEEQLDEILGKIGRAIKSGVRKIGSLVRKRRVRSSTPSARQGPTMSVGVRG